MRTDLSDIEAGEIFWKHVALNEKIKEVPAPHVFQDLIRYEIAISVVRAVCP